MNEIPPAPVTTTSVQPPELPADMQNAPGAPQARAQGCACSVLANADYRLGAAERPLIDPQCRLHAAGAGRTAAGQRPVQEVTSSPEEEPSDEQPELGLG